jgi:hypothetical protein
MMDAVSTFETLVNFYQTTQRNITDDIPILTAVRTWNLTKFRVILFYMLTRVSNECCTVYLKSVNDWHNQHELKTRAVFNSL